MDQLFLLNNVSKVELTSEGTRLLADRNPFGERSKRAIVVEPEAVAVFGMMRMFQLLTDNHPDELRVQFNHESEARAWLGLSE